MKPDSPLLSNTPPAAAAAAAAVHSARDYDDEGWRQRNE